MSDLTDIKKITQIPEDELPDHLYLALYEMGMLESQQEKPSE